MAISLFKYGIKPKKEKFEMKKKGFYLLIAILILTFCMSCFVGCKDKTPEENPDGTTQQGYTIQYTDDAGTHQITVYKDMPYSLESIPARTGYNFMGLYDAKVGGTLYVDADGASVAPFTDAKNMVLFPQFKAKEYAVVLDYQGAQVSGSRQITVAYGNSIPELPKNLEYGHKSFVGWYTKPNREGVLIADNSGTIPVVSVINENNFDLSSGYVYLYAGFEEEKYEVTCCFEPGMEVETIMVEYGTPISKIVTETRIEGKAPVAWSKTQGGEAFNGKITGETVLYAIEYAPVLDFDSDGGNDVKSIVARAGARITLPLPEKDMAKFAYWKDSAGNVFNASVMPEESLTLKAVWQAIIKFDTNGGTAVEDISVPTGTGIELPTTEKDGYIFAGWYIDDTKYTATAMPMQSVALKARYYKIAKVVKNIVSADKVSSAEYQRHVQVNLNWSDSIDLAELANVNGIIKIKGYVLLKYYNASIAKPYTIGIDFYKGTTLSDSELLSRHLFSVTTSEVFARFTFEAEWKTVSSTVYACYYVPYKDFGTPYISDLYIEIEYPDTSKLY